MAKYQVSSKLIDQVQILLNKEAGIDSFNSNNNHSLDDDDDSSFLNDAIVGSYSNSFVVDVSRCENCKGELLSGSTSIICVFCGRSQKQDCVPEAINFKSTFAFQWFLQSLGLDGFESVGTSVGGAGGSGGGRNSSNEDEITVSDFVDLQLKWPEGVKGFGVNYEEQVSGKRFLSLVGVDVEGILSEDSRDHGSRGGNEEGVVGRKVESEGIETSGEKSLSLFENAQYSEAGLRSGEGENDESFSDWGAEFTIPDPVPEKSGYVSMFDASSGGNLTTSSDNVSSNLESGSPFISKVSDGNSLVEGGKAFESVDASFDWLPADQWHTTKEDAADTDRGHGDDSFDEWGDFRISTSKKVIQSEPNVTAVPGTDSSDGLVISNSVNEHTESVVTYDIQFQNNSFRVPDDAWNNFEIPSTGGDYESQTIGDKPEQYADIGVPALGGEMDLSLSDDINLQQQGINAEITQNKIIDQDDSIGLWINDMHFDVKGDQLQGRESKSPASAGTNGVGNSFDLWNDFKGSDNRQATDREVDDNKIPTEASSNAWNDFAGLGVGKKEEQASCLELLSEKVNSNQSDSVALWNDKPLDAWNDFTGSAGVPDSKPSNDISSGAWNDFSSLMVTHENQPLSSNTRPSEDKAVLEDSSLFGSWSDFRSVGVQAETSSLGLNGTKTGSNEISFEKAPNSPILIEDNSMFSSWGDLGGTTSIEQQLQGARVGSSENKLSSGGKFFAGLSSSGKQSTSLPDNQLQFEGVTILDGKSTNENEDSFDAWTDFTRSSNALGNPSTSYAPDGKEAIKHDDLLHAWNVIDSSPNVQAGKEIVVANGKTPESNLLGPSDSSPYVGPNSSMHTDLCAGMFSHENGSAPVALSPPEVPDLVRTEHGDVKADAYDDRMNSSESTSKVPLEFKSSVAETLISEMHDLSFMLESGLSIPDGRR